MACPNCGYCPHCGRSGCGGHPWPRPRPLPWIAPYYYKPTTTGQIERALEYVRRVT